MRVLILLPAEGVRMNGGDGRDQVLFVLVWMWVAPEPYLFVFLCVNDLEAFCRSQIMPLYPA